MGGPGIVGHHQAGARQQRAQRAERQRARQRHRAMPHRAGDPMHQFCFGGIAVDRDDRTLLGKRIADLGKSLRMPAAPWVGRARLQHHQAFGDPMQGRQGARQLRMVPLAQRQPRLDGGRARADQSDAFVQQQGARMQVDVGHEIREIAIERAGARCTESRRHPGAERAHERIAVLAAAVQLQRQVELALPHLRKEIAQLFVAGIAGIAGRQGRIGRCRQAGHRGQADHLVDRSRPAIEKLRMPAFAQQGQCRCGIGGLQRLQRGQRQHVVADRVGAQHRDAAHAGDDGCGVLVSGAGRHGRLPALRFPRASRAPPARGPRHRTARRCRTGRDSARDRCTS
ncbi:hypothetical protein OJJOAM_004170 [Cupriavidus sp. H18C1]